MRGLLCDCGNWWIICSSTYHPPPPAHRLILHHSLRNSGGFPLLHRQFPYRLSSFECFGNIILSLCVPPVKVAVGTQGDGDSVDSIITRHCKYCDWHVYGLITSSRLWLNARNWISAANRSIGSTTGCTITEKAPTRAFSWLKVPTSAFTLHLRHY